jgi:benzoyl-CoA reductase/2-hydroxyglutaryl-CoA dehydratase subunit BcrC/BadD/HgdB
VNELEMDKILQWWSLKSTSPHATKEEKQYWQDKLDKVKKLVEELDNENILSRT